MAILSCSIPDCEKSGRLARGWCQMHYKRWQKHGDPLATGRLEWKACAHCSESFESRTRAKYCSKVCGQKGKPSASGLTCAVCSGPMVKGATSRPQGLARHGSCQFGDRRDDSGLTHGLSGYKRGCRCDVCVSTKREAMRRFFENYRDENGYSWNAAWRREFKEKNGYWPQRGGGGWITPATRTMIYERDGLTCYICFDVLDRSAPINDPKAPTIDHIVPRSKGGTDDLENLKTCCRDCNILKSDSMPIS